MKERANLSDQIAEDIKKKIVDGELKPGDRISGEYELADEYGVSRFTVREAMKKLASTGLVDIKHGIGMFVNAVSPESYMKPLLSVILLSANDIQMICEARLPVEVQATKLFGECATQEDLKQLHKIYEQMEVALADGDDETYSKLDVEFHLFIAKASKNTILYEMLHMMQDLLKKQMMEVYELPDSRKRSIEKHRNMLTAFEEHNVEMATLIMEQHIKDSIENLDKLNKE